MHLAIEQLRTLLNLEGPVLQPRLNLARQRAEVGHALQFVVRQLDMKMILQPGQQIERLQTVDPSALKKSSSGDKFFPRHFEMRRPPD